MNRVSTALTSSVIAVGLALVSASAMADRRGGVAWARVIDAQPIYQTVQYPVDEQVCRDEQVWRRDLERRGRLEELQQLLARGFLVIAAELGQR